MACLNLQNTYFRKHLLMAAFIRFRSTCFSEHFKVDALLIKQAVLIGIFLFTKSAKKHVPSFSLLWWKGILSLHFIMFSSLLFTPSLFKKGLVLFTKTILNENLNFCAVLELYIASIGEQLFNQTASHKLAIM